MSHSALAWYIQGKCHLGTHFWLKRNTTPDASATFFTIQRPRYWSIAPGIHSWTLHWRHWHIPTIVIFFVQVRCALWNDTCKGWAKQTAQREKSWYKRCGQCVMHTPCCMLTFLPKKDCQMELVLILGILSLQKLYSRMEMRKYWHLSPLKQEFLREAWWTLQYRLWEVGVRIRVPLLCICCPMWN